MGKYPVGLSRRYVEGLNLSDGHSQCVIKAVQLAEIAAARSTSNSPNHVIDRVGVDGIFLIRRICA